MQQYSVPLKPGNTLGNPTLTDSSRYSTGKSSQTGIMTGTTRNIETTGHKRDGKDSAGITISQRVVTRAPLTQHGSGQDHQQPKGQSITIVLHASLGTRHPGNTPRGTQTAPTKHDRIHSSHSQKKGDRGNIYQFSPQ